MESESKSRVSNLIKRKMMQPRVVEVSGGHRGDKADRHTGLRAFPPPNQALPEDSSGCYLQGTQTPFPFSLSLLLSGQENSRALGVGAITGIVIGVLLVLTPLAVLGYFIFLHRYGGIPRCCSCPRLRLVLEE